MMKKEGAITSNMILFLFLLILTIAASPAEAADHASSSVGTSEVQIQFTPGTERPEIIDPNKPDEPGDEGPNTGPLTFDFASPIAFGESEIKGIKGTYSSTTMQPYIQVTDRRGTGEGWKLTADLSRFKQKEGMYEGHEFDAELILKNGHFHPGYETDSSFKTLGERKLYSNSSKNILTAGKDEGMGSWLISWFAPENEGENTNVQLVVPGGAAKLGSYTATIEWTLEAAP